MTINVNTDSNNTVNIDVSASIPGPANISVMRSSVIENTIGATPLFGPRGEKGDKGDTGDAGSDGKGISSIDKTSTSGLVDTYTITYTDDTTSTYEVTNGADGQDGTDGTDGVGISSITKTSTVGLVDTYTITYTDSDTDTFTVANGEKGDTGNTGADGYSPTATVTKSGSVATITITDKNGTTTATVSDGVGTITDVKVDNASVVTSGVASITLSGKVDKTGTNSISADNTFSGTNTFTTNVPVINRSPAYIDFKNPDIDLGTTPSANKYCGIRFQDKDNDTLGQVYHRRQADGTIATIISCFNKSGDASTNLQVGYKSDGTSVITYAPACDEANSILTTVAKAVQAIGDGGSYFELGNGLIVQFGYHSAATTHTISFPKAFSAANSYIAMACPRSRDTTVKVAADSASGSTFTTATSSSIVWFAIGY